MNRHDSAASAAKISAAIRARRRSLHLTQAEVADFAGCSERAVRALERGSGSPRLDTLLAVLEALGLAIQVGNTRGEVVVVSGL